MQRLIFQSKEKCGIRSIYFRTGVTDVLARFARITAIDTTAAQQLPGVVAVLTREHLHDIDPYYGSTIRDRPIVAIDNVRSQGEPVAAVAAVDERTAQQALELIEVTYEELPSAPSPARCQLPRCLVGIELRRARL